MRRLCEVCRRAFDDEFRDTFCPHDAFPANDGHNNFTVHHDALLTDPLPNVEPLHRGDWAP